MFSRLAATPALCAALFVALLPQVAVSLPAPQPALEARQSFSGDATEYSPAGAVGACGVTSSDSDLIAAVPTAIYNGGAVCGQTVTITNSQDGRSVTATVEDRCAACGDSDIDLSPAAFQAIGDEAAGRVPVTWTLG